MDTYIFRKQIHRLPGKVIHAIPLPEPEVVEGHQSRQQGVPFNGTGHSGMGAYHGEWGFREFTHPQTVLKGRTRWNLTLREHPYTGEAGEKKLKILRIFER